MGGVSIAALVYPKELTDADWQKKKGTLAKTVKTGLGEALQAGEAMFKRIDLAELDPGSTPSRTREELTQKVDQAKAYYRSRILPLIQQVRDIKAAAQDAAEKLGKKPGLGSAVKAAQAVAKAAETYAVTLKSLDLDDMVARVTADIDKKDALARKLFADSCKRFLDGAKAFLSAPSFDAWDDKIKQQGRSVSNSVGQLAELRDRYWKDFQKFQGFDTGTLKLRKDDPEVVAKMQALVAAAAKMVVVMAKEKV